MSWRTVVISSRCKLDMKMGYMVVRGEQTRRIFLDEIAVLLIEHPAVAMTGCLLSALVERKVKVIFCDARRSPQAELVPYYGSHDTSRKLRQQLRWKQETMDAVWTAVIGEKLRQQALHLRTRELLREADLLDTYCAQLELRDATNREGHAAKVYFNALFGKEFTRSGPDPVNAALNYGYSVLLSAFNREIVACGYLTQLGLHHDNVFNRFNLSSDLMEPFRVLVDRRVWELAPKDLDKAVKRSLLDLLNTQVLIGETKQTVLNAIGIYVRSIFEALEREDPALIRFWTYEL